MIHTRSIVFSVPDILGFILDLKTTSLHDPAPGFGGFYRDPRKTVGHVLQCQAAKRSDRLLRWLLRLA
jgi:hypothetical protein